LVVKVMGSVAMVICRGCYGNMLWLLRGYVLVTMANVSWLLWEICLGYYGNLSWSLSGSGKLCTNVCGCVDMSAESGNKRGKKVGE
jgi:hypothetical protein